MKQEEAVYNTFPVLVREITPTEIALRVTDVIEEQRERGWHLRSTFHIDGNVFLVMWKIAQNLSGGK